MSSGAARAAALAAVCLLAACASPGDCDPTRTDLFTGFGCQVGGGYDARTNTLVAEGTAAQREAQRQVVAANDAGAAAAAAERQLHDRQDRLAVLRRQTADMQRTLDAARRRQGADAAAVAQAQSALRALQQQQNTLPAAPSEAEIRAVEERRRQVLRLIDEM